MSNQLLVLEKIVREAFMHLYVEPKLREFRRRRCKCNTNPTKAQAVINLMMSIGQWEDRCEHCHKGLTCTMPWSYIQRIGKPST